MEKRRRQGLKTSWRFHFFRITSHCHFNSIFVFSSLPKPFRKMFCILRRLLFSSPFADDGSEILSRFNARTKRESFYRVTNNKNNRNKTKWREMKDKQTEGHLSLFHCSRYCSIQKGPHTIFPWIIVSFYLLRRFSPCPVVLDMLEITRDVYGREIWLLI